MALVGLCAFAQDESESCPSNFRFSLLNGDDPTQVEIELQLINSSLNLNGFVTRILKDSESVQWKEVNGKYFTTEGYGHVILANWEYDGWTPVTDEMREEALYEMCDINSGFQLSYFVIYEILSTSDCRFFPVLEEPTGIGKFYLDMSACEDGEHTLFIENNSWGGSFTGYGNTQWTLDALDEPVTITLVKNGNTITEKDDTPQPVLYSEFYVVGTFNGWNQTEDGSHIELVENADGTQYTGEVELEDGAEFKIITPVEDGWKWFGGVDENQVGYFEINDNLLDKPIELIDGSNFKVVGDGKYIITVMQPVTGSKGVAEPLVMTVSKEATGISTIEIDKADNRIFDLQGRELKNVPEHGIYIQNGKKYIVR